MDNTFDDQAFVLFDVSPLDFLNPFNSAFNSLLNTKKQIANTFVCNKAFVLFDVSPLDFLNLFNFHFNFILFNL